MNKGKQFYRRIEFDVVIAKSGGVVKPRSFYIIDHVARACSERHRGNRQRHFVEYPISQAWRHACVVRNGKGIEWLCSGH